MPTAGADFLWAGRSANSDIAYGWMEAVGALRGRPGVSFAVGPGAPSNPKTTPTLIGVGKTGGGADTSFSALAVLHSFNPTLWRLRLAQRTLVRQQGATLPTDHDSRIRALTEIYDRYSAIEANLTERGLYLPHAKRVRLSIYLNPNAASPPPRTFAGVHDDQWDELPSNDGLAHAEVALGRDSWEWLRT